MLRTLASKPKTEILVKISTLTLAAAATLLLAALPINADDTPATQPAKPAVRLVQPYNKMADLTDDQREKIFEIHKKSLADQRAIRQKEADDIRAILTDAQKDELDNLTAQQHIKEQEQAAQRLKKKEDAATQPAAGG
jgi:Spy/CpxP family protein refolding chaperone